MFKLLALLATGLSAVQAYTTPGAYPAYLLPGNGFVTPGLAEQVPAGSPYTVTWDGTGLSNNIAILLLRGPADNVLPLYAIADGIPNTGSFVWTPSTDLEPDVTHYALQLIDNESSKFQWSAQFGISNPSYGSTPSSSAAPPPATSSKPYGGKPSGPPKSDMPPPPSTGYAKPTGGWSGPPPSYPETNCTTSTYATATSAPVKATSTSTLYKSTSYAAPPAASGYAGPLSNDAGRFGLNAASALIAVGAAAFLL
jgi:hypothetical protein